MATDQANQANATNQNASDREAQLRQVYAACWQEMFPELPRDADGNLIEDAADDDTR